MFVDMKIVPFIVAFALAIFPQDTTGVSHCKAVSEVRVQGETTRKIFFSETKNGWVYSTIQLAMFLEPSAGKPATYVALAFRPEDVTKDCIPRGNAVARSVPFKGSRNAQGQSALQALMESASLRPGSDHNILGHTVVLYSFKELPHDKWMHLRDNYNQYTPIGCGKIREADCDDDVSAKYLSMQPPTAGKLRSEHRWPARRIRTPAAEDIASDEMTSAEKADENTSWAIKGPLDRSVSAEQPADELVSAEQPRASWTPSRRPPTAKGPTKDRPEQTFIHKTYLWAKNGTTRMWSTLKNNFERFGAWIKSLVVGNPKPDERRRKSGGA